MNLPQDYSPVKLKVIGNTPEDYTISNIRSALQAGKPWLEQLPANDLSALIVAGGPSVQEDLEEIKMRYCHGEKVFCLNQSWKILDFTPDYQVMLDSRPENAEFILTAAEKYFASICHPSVVKQADVLWHPLIDGIQDVIGNFEVLVGGGTSVGTRAICLAYLLGYRTIHLYGFDSCYQEDKHHAYPQSLNDNERIIDIWMAGTLFKCAPWMVAQAEEFRDLMPQLMELGCTIVVHGQGLIPFMAKQMNKPEKILTAIYDLSCSPPTYDFLSFLCAAEGERLKGYDWIDLVFQPGPMGGFRADNLPPDVESRKQMLSRICIPACSLLPSIRNITILKERKEIDGAIFPLNWTLEKPVSCYGCGLAKTVPHALRARKKALDRIQKTNYVTITLRECEYWPDRNSNIPEWQAAAKEIEALGYEIVWVGDTAKSESVYAWDIEMRMALYQKAVCNLMVANGPCDLVRLSDAPYLIFKPITMSCPSTTPEFLAANGIEVGDQVGTNGRTVWQDDICSVIVNNFKEEIL